MSADQWIALLGVIVALLGIAVPVGMSIRKDAREQAQQQAAATRQAVLDATAPLIAERDYWRARADKFADELMALGRAVPPAAAPGNGGRRD